MSVKIRERIEQARKRFNANDNIAEFIEPGELEKLLDEVELKMQGVLESLVIDTENDHNTNDTARRPTFDTLRNAAAALAWFADRSCTVRTAAAAHHPPTEVLHVLLSRNVVV